MRMGVWIYARSRSRPSSIRAVTDQSRVLGPQNIVALMKSLESNRFIRHFLLGNNVIGPVGARVIAAFVSRYARFLLVVM